MARELVAKARSQQPHHINLWYTVGNNLDDWKCISTGYPTEDDKTFFNSDGKYSHRNGNDPFDLEPYLSTVVKVDFTRDGYTFETWGQSHPASMNDLVRRYCSRNNQI